MGKASKYILFAGLCIGSTSIFYFLSLLIHLPFVVTAGLALLATIFIYRWLPGANHDTDKTSSWAYAILALALYFITDKANTVALKYGDWDAWAIWNFHASFLASPANWKNMLLEDTGHPDYPLCLPAMLAFLRRLFAENFSPVISFAFSFFITLCIPVLVYVEQYKKNIVVAAVALLLFATDDFYIIRGVSQYADTLLAFFFLTAFICINHVADNRKYLTLTAALLGCCIWTKNEGVVLAGLFALFYAGTLFSRTNIKRSLTGIALPLIAFLVFKIFFAPANDMVAGQSHTTLSYLLTGSRYTMVWDSLTANLDKNFRYLRTGFYLYMIICIIEKKWPTRQMLLVLTCLFVYFFIYIITPRDLNWQLITSQDRLMHQLMPAMVYVIASKLSEIQFLLPQKKAL